MSKYTVEGAVDGGEKLQKADVGGEVESVKRRKSEQEEKELKEEKKAGKGGKIVKARCEENDDEYKFKLVGVVVHNGNADAGHYYSYINVKRHEWELGEKCMTNENDRWVEFNDSIISEFDFSKLEQECFGGAQEESGAGYMEEIGDVANIISGRSKSAYMLVYERKKKSLIPEGTNSLKVTEHDMIISSLECDSTAISRAERENGRIVWKNNDEVSVLHKFHNVPQVIHQEITNVRAVISQFIGSGSRQYTILVRKTCL